MRRGCPFRKKCGIRYEGCTGALITYTKDPRDSFEDMMLKMTGTVWESTYETPVDAAFVFGTTCRFDSNTRIETYLKNKHMPKYILHVVDITQGGSIPVHDAQGNFLRNDPFAGVWLEGTNEDGTPNGKGVYDTSNGAKKLCAMTWEEFGFDCGFDKLDWSNQSTDIWFGAGNIKDDPKADYPADSADGINKGDQIYANYDPYKSFDFDVYNNTTNQMEHVEFHFSVINEVNKKQVIKTLNGVSIGYPRIDPNDRAEAAPSDNSKVTNIRPLLDLTLDDEYNLGRDNENGRVNYIFKGNEQLQCAGDRFSLSYGYDRKGGDMVLSGSSSLYIPCLENNIITGGIINGNKLSASNTSQSIRINLSGGAGSSYHFWDASHRNLPRYNVGITNSAGQSLNQYFTNTVYPDIANATSISLHTDNYPTGVITGKEV